MAKKGRKSKSEVSSKDQECKEEPPKPQPFSVKALLANYRAIHDVLVDAFQGADRVNLETSWGKFMVFQTKKDDREFYFVHPGCTCDMKCLPRRMEYFPNIHETIKFIVSSSVLNAPKPAPPPCCKSQCAHEICCASNKGRKFKSK